MARVAVDNANNKWRSNGNKEDNSVLHTRAIHAYTYLRTYTLYLCVRIYCNKFRLYVWSLSFATKSLPEIVVNFWLAVVYTYAYLHILYMYVPVHTHAGHTCIYLFMTNMYINI